jgi:hypothetical protein
MDDAFKVSDNLALVGWNPSMELREIFDTMMSTYGRPTPAALLQNDTLFCSVYSPQDAPEVLFRCSKDCQEVQILGNDPYTPQQMLNNAVCLLLGCGLYTRDFEDWDCKPAAEKIWTNLKTFIQEAYTCRLNATSITAGSQGYIQNAFNVLQESDDEDDDVNMVITQMAALTTQSQITATTAAETTALVMAAIHQLAANQQAMQQQFAAFATECNTTYQQVPAAQPLIAGITIPAFPTFNMERHGRRGGQGHGTNPGNANTSGRNARTPFANFVGRQGGQGGLPPIGGGGGQHTFGINPFVPVGGPAGERNAAPMYSNIIKHYANWNACFSCGFDVEDGHTLKTCPTAWRCMCQPSGWIRLHKCQSVHLSRV